MLLIVLLNSLEMILLVANFNRIDSLFNTLFGF